MEPHVSDDSLIALADEVPSASEVEEHVRTCADCTERLSFYRTLSSDLKDIETWRIEKERRTNRGSAAIAAFAARIESEDAAAAELLAELLEVSAKDPDRNFAAEPRFQTGGVVRALEKTVYDERLIDPPVFERLSRLLCDLAESLPDDYYPGTAVFELRGRAWVLRATAFQNTSRFPEALDAIDRAAQAYERLADPGGGLASVMMARAIQSYRLNRCAEALPFASAAAAEYERRGDTQKYVHAMQFAAVLLYKSGDSAGALKMNLNALPVADRLDDAELHVAIRHNLSLMYRSIGDLETSSSYLLEALHMSEALGSKTLVAHCRYSAGALALAKADFENAETLFRSAVEAFLEVGWEQAAAEAKLDLAEALLMLGRPQEIERLCTEAETFFAKVGLVTGRLEAVRFLKTAAANHMLRREDIQHVRTYLDESREKPDVPFAPPPPRDRGAGH